MSNPQSFIHDLLKDHEGKVETPISWIYWSLMACISAAAANNFTVVTLKGRLIYYPNIYVMLLGESGLGKGYPVNLVARLLEEANITRVIKGRSSIQGIVKEMATARSREGKPVIIDGRVCVINGELSTAVIADPDALTILTDLFDRNYNKNWTNLLKGDGPEKLKEPYITCLFGSSLAHFYDTVPQANIEGGYIGRNLMVYEEKRALDLDLIDSETNGEEIDEDRFMSFIVPNFVPHLIKIAEEKPKRLIPTEKARELYNTWRREWRGVQSVYNDKTGFVNRVPDHVMKVAMCLSLSRFKLSGMIEEEDFIEAIEKVTSLIYTTQKTAEATGIDPLAQQVKKVLDYLLSSENNQLTRTELLIKGYGNYDPTALDKAIDTLLDMKWCERERIVAGKESDWLVRLIGEPLARYRKFKEGKEKK